MTPTPIAPSLTDAALITKARRLYCRSGSRQVQIDADAEVNEADGGVWVGAWVWVDCPDDDVS